MKLQNNLIRGPLAIIAIGLLLAAGWWNHAAGRNELIQRQEFEGHVTGLVQQLRDRFNIYERGLRGARGAIAAAGGEAVTYKSFLAYIRSRDLGREYPGAHGIGFIRSLSTGQEQAFVARTRREGLPDFAIHDLAPHGDEHFIVQYIEPLEHNRLSLGLDIASEGSRRNTALEALRSGAATLTAPITLVQATGNPQRGFLLLLPVYREHEAGGGLRGNAYGWVYSPLVIDEVLADFDHKTYTFSLTDTTDPQSSLIFYQSPESTRDPLSSLSKRMGMKQYGRDWVLDVTASDDFIRHLNLSSPVREACVILLLFALFAAAQYFYLRGLQRRLQETVSAQLGDAAPEAMLVVDERGNITYANKRLEAMFGYSLEELQGNKMEILLPEQLRQRHVADRGSYDRVPRIMGQGRYLIAQRKNGEQFPVEVSLGPLQAGGKRLTVGMVVDITLRRKMEDALRASEERFRETLNQAPALVWIADRENKGTWYNRRWLEYTGRSMEHELGFGWIEGMHPDDRERCAGICQAAFDKRERFEMELRLRRADGSYGWIVDTGIQRFDADGNFEGYIGYCWDITDRKNAERETAITKERLRRGQMFANIGTWDWNIQTGELYWTERIAPLFGYPVGELETSYDNFLAAIHPDDRQAVIDAVNAAVEHDAHYEIEHRVVWPDGSVRWLLERGAVARDAEGKPLQMLGVVQDINDRKRAEMALVERERELREAQTLARFGSWSAEPASGKLVWSDEVYVIFGRDQMSYTLDLPSYYRDIIHPDDVEKVRREELAAYTSGRRHSIDHRFIHTDGSVGWVHIEGQAVQDEASRAVRLAGTIQDITERVEAENRLHETEERFSFAVEGAGDGIWDWNIPTGAMPLSGHYEEMLGYRKGELEPTISAWIKSVHPDDLPRAQANLKEYLEGRLANYTIELRLHCKDGGYKWILCRGTVVERDKDGKPLRMIGIHTDIHQRKNNEDRLALFARVFDEAEGGVGITDAEGRLVYVNRAHEQMFGYEPDEMIGMHVAGLHPESELEVIGQLMGSAVAEGYWSGLLSARRKDGGKFVTTNNVGVIRDEQGKPRYFFNLMYDYAPELVRQEELRSARDQAEAANRAKSEFLSSMSHELRTPLNAVIGFGQLLESDGQLNSDQQDSVNEIIKAGRHLLELVNEVLDLAKIESGRIDLSLEPVAVSELVAECRSLLRPMAEQRGISIDCEECGETLVRADRVRLKQVLLNLLTNAIKYNRDNGSVTLSRLPGRDGYLRLAVRDTGHGIAAERMNELFQPFNRLDAEKSAIEGTGIGLSITRRLVEMMGGEIGVESQAGEGSTFWIELPAAAGQSHGDAALADSGRYRALAGQHTVLYVEDNPANLKLVSQILARRPNIRLLTAHTPQLGIDLARAHRPHLALLDINMPEMDGYQVLKIFRGDASLAGMPVVAVTANAMPRDIERGRQAGFKAYLTKPINVDRFLETVDGLLLEYAGHHSDKELTDGE